jgi:hypothetical protein
VFGQIDGGFWHAAARPDANGTVTLRVPHGLQDVQMQLSTNEHGALRYRIGKDQPLKDDNRMVRLGTLNDDVHDFEIIRYKAPIVLISAVDEAGSSIDKLQIVARYAKGRPEAYISFANNSDIRFESQNNGQHRSTQMLPDEDITFTITSEGYAPVEVKRNFKEGVTEELKVTLKRSDAAAKPE